MLLKDKQFDCLATFNKFLELTISGTHTMKELKVNSSKEYNTVSF